MKRTGFTLVEILIVVIILGILAAIVIPQFTQASEDARTSALVSDLQTVRSQLELYKVQHLEVYPHLDENGALDTEANFVLRMTRPTDLEGSLTPAVGAKTFGPYLQKFPSNPFSPVAPDGVTFGTADPAPGGDTGWYYNTGTVWPGKFSANDADADHRDL